MKVILLENVNNLGSTGDNVKVKDGYARNFLFPKKLAIEATALAVKAVEEKKKRDELKENKLVEDLKKVSERLKNISITIPMEAGEGDKLFGAVTSEAIIESLAKEKVTIDKKQVILDEPIKALGLHDVNIKLHREVTAQVKVWVVKK